MNDLLGILILGLCGSSCFSQNLKGLTSVVIIFRHGDRNVIDPYPTDPYRNVSYWPGGYGELTEKGKQRHIEFGRWSRKRYDGFLPKIYSPHDIKVQSSVVRRCVMSARSYLAGLYVSGSEEVQIHWRLRKDDPLLAMKKPCKKYGALMQRLLGSKEFTDIQIQLKDIYAYISQNGGRPVRDLQNLQWFYDILRVEDEAGYVLPEWTRKIYPEKLLPWASFNFKVETYTPEMARLKTGPLLDEIVEHFKNITKHEDASYQKFKVYSAHDATLGGVLNTLGIFNNLPFPYAAGVLLELHHHNNTHFVNILYKNTSGEPYDLKMSECDFDCDFNKFQEILKPFTIDPKTWEKECAVSVAADMTSILILLLTVIIVLL